MQNFERGHCRFAGTGQAVTVRRGFTLIESLMAAGILLVIVVAVSSVVTAGQLHGFETQQRISGTIAAEELLGRLVYVEFDDLSGWDDYTEEVGEMLDARGEPMPASFSRIGRTVIVSNTLMVKPVTGVNIEGRVIRVRCFDSNDRILADIQRFIPRPGKAPSEDGE